MWVEGTDTMEKTSVIVEGSGEQCGGSLDTGSLPDIINAEGTDIFETLFNQSHVHFIAPPHLY